MLSLTIFLDSSVILSGLASSTGGSRKLFEAAKKSKVKLLASPSVVQEVSRNLQKLTIDPEELKNLLSTKTVQLVSDPSEEMVMRFSRAISDPNDAHILAAAMVSGADILVSLDKKHILTQSVKKILKPILVHSPREFWEWLRTGGNFSLSHT